MKVVGSYAVKIDTTFPRPGWEEQDQSAWERALAPAVAGALAAANVEASDVRALGVAGQLDGCVAVDAAGEPLHAALIWQDRRAIDHVGGGSFAITGQVADASHMAPKIAWL